jgi:hypothetical protein
VDGPHRRAPAALVGDEPERLRVRRRLRAEHDPRTFGEQHVAKASGIGDDADGRRRHAVRHLGGRPVDGKDQPRGTPGTHRGGVRVRVMILGDDGDHGTERQGRR